MRSSARSSQRLLVVVLLVALLCHGGAQRPAERFRDLVAQYDCSAASVCSLVLEPGVQYQLEGTLNIQGDVTIIGNGATLRLDINQGTGSIQVAIGARLQLNNLAILMQGNSPPRGLLDSSSTLWDVIGSPTLGMRSTQALILSNSNITITSCTDWELLRRAFCERGLVWGDVQVTGQSIDINHLNPSGPLGEWVSTKLILRSPQGPQGPQACDTSDAIPNCVTRALTPGGNVLTVLQEANSRLQIINPAPQGPTSRTPTQGGGQGAGPAQQASSRPVPRILMQLPPGQFKFLNEGATGASNDVPLQMYYNVTVTGAGRGQGPLGHSELDLGHSPSSILPPSIIQLLGGAVLTLRRLTLVNTPSEPSAYPEGLLTCLPWFVKLPSRSETYPRLVIQDAVIVLPSDQLDYLRLWAQASETSAVGGNRVGPPSSLINSAIMRSNRVLTPEQARATPMVLESVFGGQDVWQWINVQLFNNELPEQLATPRLVTWTGMQSTLLLPKEAQDGSPSRLSSFHKLQSNLSLDLLDIPDYRGVLPPYDASHFLLQSPVTVIPSNRSSVRVRADVLVVGDPLRPWRCTVDLGQARPDTNGLVVLGQQGNAPAASLYLRSMHLYNAQPARIPPAGPRPPSADNLPRLLLHTPTLAPGGDGVGQAPGSAPGAASWPRRLMQDTGVEPRGREDQINALLHNFTSLLWMFRPDRGADCLAVAPTRSTQEQAPPPPPPPASALCAVLDLANVTITVSPLELQVIRLLAASNSPPAAPLVPGQLLDLGLNRVAALLLIEQLRASNYSLMGEDKSIPTLATQPSTNPLAPGLPGDIVFNRLAWFGISGANVTFTSVAPAGVDVVSVVVQLLANFPTAPAPTPASPPAAWPSPASPGVAPPALPQDLSPRGPVARAPQEGGSSGSDVSGWRLAVLVVGVVIVASGVAAAVTALVIRSHRRKRQVLAKSEGGSGDDMALAGVFPSSSPRNPSRGGYAPNPLAAMPGAAPKAASPAGSSALGDGMSSGYPGTSLLVATGPPGAGGLLTSERQDTDGLLEEIFREADRDGTPMGSMVSTVPGSMRSPRAAGAGMLGAVPSGGSDGPVAGAGLAVADDPRSKIQRGLALMKDELHGSSSSPWEVQGQLGKGAFGVVYKGKWRGLDVAIKRVIFQVLSGDSGEEITRNTALREAAINATLDHPHIVATYTYDMQPLGGSKGRSGGVSDWQMYIVQEYCDGGSLFDAIQARRFHHPVPPSGKEEAGTGAEGAEGAAEEGEEGEGDRPAAGRVMLPEILTIASHIASGCAYIHSKNIIHGDLKPDNVLLKLIGTERRSSVDMGSAPEPGCPGCVAKVGDFGMSMNIRGSNTHISGVRHGTPLYIPPEILRNGKASKAADVYSFGVIMWELYHGTSAWQHLLQVTGGPVRKRSLLTFQPELYAYDTAACPLPAYAELGRACLSEDPAARPTFTEVEAALEAMRVQLGAEGALGGEAGREGQGLVAAVVGGGGEGRGGPLAAAEGTVLVQV